MQTEKMRIETSWMQTSCAGALRARVAVVVCGMAASLLGCSTLMLSSEPQTTSDPPSTNRSTSKRVEGVPYCSAGNRAEHCVLGENCRVTEAGCQVCQCASLSQ